MRLTGLADHLRNWGFDVVEEPGWKTRGAHFDAMPQVVVCHHTGTKRSTVKDYPSLAVVRDGRTKPDGSRLPGPLSQLGLGYSGKVYVIAAGKANHAGEGEWRGIDVGNSRSVGIEAESPGDGTWTPKQREVYPRLAACVAAYLEQPADNICAHRESAKPPGRKPDPVGIDMPRLRAAAAGWLERGGRPPTAPQPPAPTTQEDAMYIIECTDKPKVPRLVEDGKPIRKLDDPALVKAYKAAGVRVARMLAVDYDAVERDRRT